MKAPVIALSVIILIAFSSLFVPNVLGDTVPTGDISLVQGGTENVSIWSYGPTPNPIGTNFTVDIRIDDGTYITHWFLGNVSWNPAVIQLTGIDEGNYLKDSGYTNFMNSTQALNGILINPIYCFTSSPVEGDGVLASLNFMMVGYGDAELQVKDAILACVTSNPETGPALQGVSTPQISLPNICILSSVPTFKLTTTTLILESLYLIGAPTPTGNPNYPSGSIVTASVISPYYHGYDNYQCTGWVGTGDVPASGVGTSVTFTMTRDSSITWLWEPLNLTPSPSPTLWPTSNPSVYTPQGIISLVKHGTQDISCWSYGPSPDPINTTFAVDIRIDGGANVWGWTINNVTWNPDVVQLVGGYEGNYLRDEYSTLFAFSNVSGFILPGSHGNSMSCAILDSNVSASSSSGVLGMLRFKIVGYGDPNITFADICLVYPDYSGGNGVYYTYYPQVNFASITVCNSSFEAPEYGIGALAALISAFTCFALFSVVKKHSFLHHPA